MKELTKIKKKRIKMLNLIKTHHYENLTLQDILAKVKAVPKKKTEINDRKIIKKQTKIKKDRGDSSFNLQNILAIVESHTQKKMKYLRKKEDS